MRLQSQRTLGKSDRCVAQRLFFLIGVWLNRAHPEYLLLLTFPPFNRGVSPDKPVVASFCVTFLAPEMLHVYRQITGLQEFRPHVLTQKWIHRERFPFPEEQISVVPKSKARFFADSGSSSC